MNQCMCRFFGILLVVVIYTAFTVEGVGFGVSCASGEICDDPNTVCPGSGTLECGCAATYYRKSDNSACALIVTTLTGNCDTADTAAEQCGKTDTECTADGGVDKCLCKATHYSDGTDCQFRITYESACSNTVADTSQCAVTNQECSLESGTTNYKCQCTADYYGDGTGCAAKIAFGGDCSGGKECAGDNTACPGSGTIVCGCAATYYRNSGDTACVLIVSTLTGACDTTDTATEQCSYANTECTADGGGGKCLCKATHYSDGTDCQIRITYESACSNTVADTSQCAVTNQECSLESGTTNYKCQCTADYYGDGTGCAAKIAFGGDCSGGKECAGDNTACPGSGTIVCGCAATYYRNSGDTACVLIVTTLSGVCDIADTAAEQCSYANTECTADGGGGKCLCKATHYSDGTDCQTKIAFGVDCSGGKECAGDSTACPGSGTIVCGCAATYYRNSGDTACVLIVSTLTGACDTTDTAAEQCSYANTECTADGGGGKCLCKATHYSDGTDCQTKIALNTACTTSPTGQCADSRAACDGTALLCKCTTGNFEKNDGTCAGQIPNLEDGCVTAETASDQCTVAESECRAAQCLCKDTHYKTGTTCTIRKNPDETACVAGGCVTHATCDTSASPTICECDAGYTASPTSTPTMCSSNGEVKLSTPSYIYVVPIIVSMFFLLR